jgi:hypothetical protein
MTKLEIRRLNEDEFPLWDDFVDESPQGTLFHKTFWLRTAGYKFTIYGYFREGMLLAGFPLPYRTEFGIKLAMPPPLTPYLGVIFKRQDTKYVTRLSQEKKISREIAHILKGSFHHISYGFPPGAVDLQPFVWEGFATSITYTYIVHLENELENIWMALTDKNRNQIRKAEKDGITVVQSDDFSHTVSLVEKTFARQNKSLFPESAACSSNDVLKKRNQCKSFLAKNADGDLIAAAYIVWDNKRAYYQLGGYDSERSHGGASALALWEAIKFSKEQLNLKEFDFEGSMIPRLEEFFREFGGELLPCYHVDWTKPGYKIYISARRLLSKFDLIRQMYTRVYARR